STCSTPPSTQSANEDATIAASRICSTIGRPRRVLVDAAPPWRDRAAPCSSPSSGAAGALQNLAVEHLHHSTVALSMAEIVLSQIIPRCEKGSWHPHDRTLGSLGTTISQRRCRYEETHAARALRTGAPAQVSAR